MKKVKVKLTLKLDVKTDPSDDEMMRTDIIEAAKERLEDLESETDELDFEVEEDEEEEEDED